jgi:hypothetical protein
VPYNCRAILCRGEWGGVKGVHSCPAAPVHLQGSNKADEIPLQILLVWAPGLHRQQERVPLTAVCA